MSELVENDTLLAYRVSQKISTHFNGLKWALRIYVQTWNPQNVKTRYQIFICWKNLEIPSITFAVMTSLFLTFRICALYRLSLYSLKRDQFLHKITHNFQSFGHKLFIFGVHTLDSLSFTYCNSEACLCSIINGLSE